MLSQKITKFESGSLFLHIEDPSIDQSLEAPTEDPSPSPIKPNANSEDSQQDEASVQEDFGYEGMNNEELVNAKEELCKEMKDLDEGIAKASDEEDYDEAEKLADRQAEIERKIQALSEILQLRGGFQEVVDGENNREDRKEVVEVEDRKEVVEVEDRKEVVEDEDREEEGKEEIEENEEDE
jgi:hypothetical protein